MQRTINLTHVICVQIGKTIEAKPPPGDFKVTILQNPLLSITSDYKYKEFYQTLWPIPKYQPTVEPLP